ncbi:hypothetical protein PY793_07845 [Acetobacter fabarum]|uniref:hypothetical protein n=1 Tax=Acetobacter fabarum TaxID=483199 RepID=UPI00312BC7CB
MKSTDDRRLFGTPIGAAAAAGNIAVIPQIQAVAGDGTASVALGFPPETFIARAAGGEPPRGQDMNGLLNLLSSAMQVLQAGWIGAFDATFAQSIGGYPAGAIVGGGVPGTFWVSTADANVSTPGANGAAWQSLFNGYATQAWVNQWFLATGESDLQTVTGPVTFSGITTVPTPTDYTQKQAIGASDADARYARLTGGNTVAGQQVFSGNVITAGTAHFEAYDQNGGQASTVFGAYDPGTGNDNVEAFFNIINSARTQVQQFMLMGSGRIASSSLGNVAFVSQLPQTGFVTGGIYSIVKGDTSGVSVMSLSFVATITARPQFVTFPMAFSSAPIINVNNGSGMTSQGGVQIRAYGATALGVYIEIADTLGGVHITARGPV